MRDAQLSTADVRRARRYAARARILVALAGGLALLADPSIDPHPLTAALGLGVIFLTGLLEATTDRRALLRVEEPFSCLAGIFIVGFGQGQVTPIVLLWLVAVAVGVLARGGRVGVVGRVLVLGTLLSPVVTTGGVSAESAGLAAGSILLMLSVGRLSRETAELLRRARYDASHDALTGALAPTAYRDGLDRCAAVATPDAPLAVLLADLDDFGQVNKRRGHAAGDAAIVATAEALRAQLPADAVLARIDGDTFAITAAHSDPAALADELRSAIDLPVSFGIARAPQDGDDAEALLGAADVALRIAKRTGKGRAVVYEGAPLTSSGADGARAALGRLLRGEGLAMAVQPIVDPSTGDVHAYEALARFQTAGGQGPLHWFALAEELGLRAELELACLEASLALLDDLPAGTRLSVNLSAPMLADPRVTAVLAARGRLDTLIIEVTEGALATDDGTLMEQIAGLRERGARFAVDDIGAGYSGLGQIATLRPSYLKLDRMLVTGLHTDPARASLVAAMATYAASTDALLVAEGVEEEAELEVLRGLGAPLIQGYLLSRPGPPWPTVTVPGVPALRAAA